MQALMRTHNFIYSVQVLSRTHIPDTVLGAKTSAQFLQMMGDHYLHDTIMTAAKHLFKTKILIFCIMKCMMYFLCRKKYSDLLSLKQEF